MTKPKIAIPNNKKIVLMVPNENEIVGFWVNNTEFADHKLEIGFSSGHTFEIRTLDSGFLGAYYINVIGKWEIGKNSILYLIKPQLIYAKDTNDFAKAQQTKFVYDTIKFNLAIDINQISQKMKLVRLSDKVWWTDDISNLSFKSNENHFTVFNLSDQAKMEANAKRLRTIKNETDSIIEANAKRLRLITNKTDSIRKRTAEKESIHKARMDYRDNNQFHGFTTAFNVVFLTLNKNCSEEDSVFKRGRGYGWNPSITGKGYLDFDGTFGISFFTDQRKKPLRVYSDPCGLAHEMRLSSLYYDIASGAAKTVLNKDLLMRTGVYLGFSSVHLWRSTKRIDNSSTTVCNAGGPNVKDEHLLTGGGAIYISPVISIATLKGFHLKAKYEVFFTKNRKPIISISAGYLFLKRNERNSS